MLFYIIKKDEKTNVSNLRIKFNQFITENNIPLKDISEQQFINLDYMNQFRGKSFKVDCLLNCIEYTYNLKKLLIQSLPLKKEINTTFINEKNSLLIAFANEHNLTLPLENRKVYYESIAVLERHKDWSDKLKEIDNRQKAIQDSCINASIAKFTNFLNSMPKYMTHIPIRLILGIEFILAHSLDEILNLAPS